MLNILGNILQILMMCFCTCSIIISSFRLANHRQIKLIDESSRNKSELLFYFAGFCNILAFLLLVYGFIISDFSIKNIFFNSSTVKPVIYKVAASWANHEGSMLLWLMISSIITMLYVHQSNEKFREKNIQIIILASVQLLLASFSYFTSNPFQGLSFQPEQGLGLNPTLQDIALVIHPPILYIGNASFIVPFCAACLSLLKTDFAHEDLKLAYTYTKIGMLALSLGVGLGGWWAYRELGWGGYWFFDPVENISIMPWLSGVALYHSLMIAHKTGKLLGWSISLAIITFLLCLAGMLLVRSGILVSVHAFANSPERALYLLVIFIVITLNSIGLLILKSNKFVNNHKLRNKDLSLIVSNIIWLLGVVILIGGVIYPLVYELFSKRAIVIDNFYYINFFIPVILPTLLIAGVFTSKYLHDSYKIVFLIAIAITVIVSRYIPLGVIAILALFSSIFLILQTSYLFLVKTNYFKNNLSASSASMISSHLGFGLLVLFITLNMHLQNEQDFIGKINDTTQFNEFKISLNDIKFSSGPNYYRQIVEFWLEDKKGNITVLKPENRLYQIEKTLSQESDIFSYLFYDLYAVLNKIDDDLVHAKIYYRPLISFIWLSVILIATGFFISLIKRYFIIKSAVR